MRIFSIGIHVKKCLKQFLITILKLNKNNYSKVTLFVTLMHLTAI